MSSNVDFWLGCTGRRTSLKVGDQCTINQQNISEVNVALFLLQLQDALRR